MTLEGVSHLLPFRDDATVISGILTLAAVSDLTKETLLDLYMDFLLDANFPLGFALLNFIAHLL